MADEAQSHGRWEGFEAAQGYVRDGLASLRNLEHLLKSPRIGPRALEQVVAELLPVSRPLGEAFTTIIDLIDARHGSGAVPDSLRAFARDRIGRLDGAIAKAAGSDMGAKSRLKLESQVVRLGADLDALRDLMDLLDASTTFLPTELDLNALTMESLAKLAPPAPKHPRRVQVAFTAAPDRATVVADPRVIMPLLATALGIVAASRAESILVSAEVDEMQQTLLTLRPQSNGQAATIPCVPPPIIEPSLDVVRAAASLTRTELTVDEAKHSVCILIPPGQVSQTVVKPNAQPQG